MGARGGLCKCGGLSECAFGAVLHAFHAEDAFRAVLSFSRVIGHVHVHGAHPSALSAIDAFIFFARNAEQRKIAHRL